MSEDLGIVHSRNYGDSWNHNHLQLVKTVQLSRHGILHIGAGRSGK